MSGKNLSRPHDSSIGSLHPPLLSPSMHLRHTFCRIESQYWSILRSSWLSILIGLRTTPLSIFVDRKSDCDSIRPDITLSTSTSSRNMPCLHNVDFLQFRSLESVISFHSSIFQRSHQVPFCRIQKSFQVMRNRLKLRLPPLIAVLWTKPYYEPQ